MIIVKAVQEIYLENGARLLRKEGFSGEIIWTSSNGETLDKQTTASLENEYQQTIIIKKF